MNHILHLMKTYLILLSYIKKPSIHKSIKTRYCIIDNIHKNDFYYDVDYIYNNKSLTIIHLSVLNIKMHSLYVIIYEHFDRLGWLLNFVFLGNIEYHSFIICVDSGYRENIIKLLLLTETDHDKVYRFLYHIIQWYVNCDFINLLLNYVCKLTNINHVIIKDAYIYINKYLCCHNYTKVQIMKTLLQHDYTYNDIRVAVEVLHNSDKYDLVFGSVNDFSMILNGISYIDKYDIMIFEILLYNYNFISCSDKKNIMDIIVGLNGYHFNNRRKCEIINILAKYKND